MTSATLPEPAAEHQLTPGFRRCDTTGLSVCLSAQRFIKLNAVAAVVFLFKPDAEAWLKGQPAADPAAFD